MIDEAQIQDLDAQQLRQVVRTLIADVAGKDAQIAFKQAFIDKLTHEMAVLKRLKFAAQSEAYNAEQRSLHQSTIGERALKFFIQLYEIERAVHELDAAQRKRIRQGRSRPVADAMHLWLAEQRKKVPEGSATAKAIDYSLGRWPALTRYIDCARANAPRR